MIGRLRGIVIEKSQDHLLIDVMGVGYVVYCSDRTLADLPQPGQEAVVHTDLQVREDLMQLYGFASPVEREWYRLLTSVQGVGSRAAMAILGTLGVGSLSRALTLADTNSVRAAPGVGPKLAARICNELQDKAAKLIGKLPADQQPDPLIEPMTNTQANADNAIDFSADTSPSQQAEAISALVNLGYDRVLAAQTVSALSAEDLSLNDLITAALRAMAPAG